MKVYHPAPPARIQITSTPNSHLSVPSTAHPEKTVTQHLISGYAHLPNPETGVEDRHSFFTIFLSAGLTSETLSDESLGHIPLIITFGGGPGATGYVTPFRGASALTLSEPESKAKGGVPTLIESKNPWTAFANVLALEHPVGVGFSFAEKEGRGIPISSEDAGRDVDAMLQGLMRSLPAFRKSPLYLHSISYGGTFSSNILNQVRIANEHHLGKQTEDIGDEEDRLIVKFDGMILGNPWMDFETHARWWHHTKCVDHSLYPSSLCASHILSLPSALDAIHYARHINPCPESRRWASQIAWEFDNTGETREGAKMDPGDVRFEKLDGHGPFYPLLENFINLPTTLRALGLSTAKNWEWQSSDLNEAFDVYGDPVISAHDLLGPLIDDGLRVLVYSGLCDTGCGWRASLAWMSLVPSPHLASFRASQKTTLPGIGWIRSSTLTTPSQDESGKEGVPDRLDYALVGIEDAGHDAMIFKGEVVSELVKKFVAVKEN